MQLESIHGGPPFSLELSLELCTSGVSLHAKPGWKYERKLPTRCSRVLVTDDFSCCCKLADVLIAWLQVPFDWRKSDSVILTVLARFLWGMSQLLELLPTSQQLVSVASTNSQYIACCLSVVSDSTHLPAAGMCRAAQDIDAMRTAQHPVWSTRCSRVAPYESTELCAAGET